MLGAAGALMCMAAGTALGVAVRERRYARLRLIENELELLARLRLMLLEERLGLCQLLRECAAIGERGIFPRRMELTARTLENDPLTGSGNAYLQACHAAPAAWEQGEEKAALKALFNQLGTGTAAMREQAVASCMRRLRPCADHARSRAESGGKLFMQLGLLLGLMLGIALW